MSDDQLRVCLLLDGPMLPRWQADALSRLLAERDVVVTTVVYDDSDARTVGEALGAAIELREWAVVGTLNELLFGTARGEYVPLESVLDLDSVTERSVVPAAVDGWKQRLPAEPVEAAAAESDVAIRFGFGFITGPVLTAFDHGVLSYHHGDLRTYRGQPMGFWEFVHGEETAGVTVQQLTDELDAGRVAALRTVDIADARTWKAVKRRLLAASEPLLAEAVRNLQHGRLRDPEELGSIYTHPTGIDVVRFAVKNAMGHVRESVRRDGREDDGDTRARTARSGDRA